MNADIVTKMFNSIRPQLCHHLHQKSFKSLLLTSSSVHSINAIKPRYHSLYPLPNKIVQAHRLFPSGRLVYIANKRVSFRTFKTNMAGVVVTKDILNQHEELFESTYQQILEEMSRPRFDMKSMNEVQSWFGKVIEYNLKNGKRNRAKSLALAYEQFAPKSGIENLRMACILGWCVEFLQAYFLVVDDIMDNSITRRGQLCWYRKESVGMTAINDAIMLNNCIYQLLRDHLGSHPSYLKIVDFFNEVTRFTAYGQCLDLISNPLNKKLDLSKFTDDRYDAIVLYKTAFYTFSLPIRLAMYLAHIDDPEAHRKAEEILLKIGHLFQVQDDYLDCYGDPKVTGKIGTDIEDGKCSWPIVKALQMANQTQLEVITTNYGIQCEESVAKIKSVYKELDIEGFFRNFEKQQFNEICALVKELDDKLLVQDVFYGLLTLTYQRKK